MMRPTENDLRQTIAKICHLMYEKDFICASDGNVSARLESGRLLITPSGVHKGLLEPEQILVVDESGKPIGPRTRANRDLRPTSELPMHLEAYRQRPDIGAVVHAHPPIAVALSIAGISLAECLLPEVIVFLGLIPTSKYATPSSRENVIAIRDLIKQHDGLVLKRHGSLTVGDTPLQAFMRLETLEQQARMIYRLTQLGVHNPMPPREIQKLIRMRQQMGLSHLSETAEFQQLCGVSSTNGQVSAHSPDEVREMVAEVVRQTLGAQDV